MRLIDADEFLVEASKQLDMQDLYLPVHIKDMVIDAMPTVEAIPVEWIEKWLDEFLGTKLEEEITDLDPFKKNVYQGILLMYNDWRRQK